MNEKNKTKRGRKQIKIPITFNISCGILFDLQIETFSSRRVPNSSNKSFIEGSGARL